MKKLKLFFACLLMAVLSIGQVWGEVVSGTAYDIKGNTLPTNWTSSNTWSGNSTTSYFLLTEAANYVQTEEFCQDGFTSIVVSARKYGGPSADQLVITVEWVPTSGDPVVLGTLSPSKTSMADLTISSPASVTGNTTGSIKVSCKGAGGGKGSGINKLTVNYTAGSCGGGEEPTQVATPSFSLAEGSYEGTQSVTITCATEGATIYYTTDGGTPSSSSTEYKGAISVSATQTIKAIAIKDGLDNSEVAGATYTITEGPDVTLDLIDGNWGFPTSDTKTLTEYTNSETKYAVSCYATTAFKVNNSQGYFIIGKSGSYILLPEFANPIEKIVVVGNSGGSASVVFNIFDGDAAASTAVTGCGSDQTFEITNPEANKQYSLKVTSGHNLQLKAIKIYYGAAPAVAQPTISGETPFLNSTNVTISIPDGATVYYTTDGSTPTDASNEYSVPFALNNSATVKAIAKIGSDYSSVAEKAFTKATVMTVAQARAAIDAGGDLTNKFVVGIISQIDSYNSTYNSITYWISDDGTTTDQLQVYSGLAGVVKAAFTSEDDLAVGDDVTVKGTLKKYSSTYEFDKNNTIEAYKPIARLSWSAESFDAALEGENTFPSLTNTNGVTVSYSSSDPTKASFADASVYEITLNAAGSTTITATFAGNETYKANSASYTLNVASSLVTLTYNVDGGEAIEPVNVSALPNPLPTTTKAGKNFGGWFTDPEKEVAAVPGAAISENTTLYAKWLDPYNITAAKAVIDATPAGTANQYVAGKISQIDSYNSTYHSITYWISDDGTTTNQLQVYSGLIGNAATPLGKEQFSAVTDLELGDEVVVFGTLKLHNSTTYEFDKNNTIYSFNRPVVASISADPVAVDAAAHAGQSVTITYENWGTVNVADAEATLWDNEACDEDFSGDWISNVDVAANFESVSFDIAANTGAARTAYMKIYALGDDATTEAEKVIAISQEAYVAPAEPASLPFAFDGGKADIATTQGMSQDGLDNSDYASSPKLKFKAEGAWVIIEIASAPGKLTYDIKGNSFSGGTFKVQESADGSDYSDVATYTELGGTTQNEEKTLDQDTRFVKFIYTTKDQGNVALGNIAIAEYVAPAAVETPVFSPAGGEYAGAQSVTISCETGGATIYYTTNGDDPDNTKTLYEGAINVDATMTIKAIAYKDEDHSEIATATYTIIPALTDYYQKVTSGDVAEGTYLIVYEEGSLAFNGGLTTLDAENNTIDVVITNDNKIGVTQATAAATFYINPTAGSIQAANGKYIGVGGNSNGLKTSDNADTYTHDFSIDGDGNAVIAPNFEGSTMSLRYNAASNQARFRYYKDNGQQAIQLYKLANETIKDDPELAWNGDVEITVGGEFASPTLTHAAGITGTITYTSDKETVATVDENGVISLVAEATGTAHITASYAGDENFKSGEAVCTIKVNPANSIYVSPSLNVNFGSVAKDATVEDKVITVTLTGVPAASVALAGDGASAFTFTPDALTASGDITISASSATAGTFAATLTISDDAGVAASKVVNLSLTVTEPEIVDDLSGTWVLATAVPEVGEKFIVAGTYNSVTKTMGAQNANNRAAVESSLSEGVLTPGEGTKVFTLVNAGEGKYAIQASNGKYLSAAGTGTNNYLREVANYEAVNAQWTISISEGFASVVASSSNRNDLQYNKSNPGLFSCYATNGQTPIQFFVQQSDTPEPVLDWTEVRDELEVNRFYTVCLPKAITHIKGATFWTLANRNEAGTLAYLDEEVASVSEPLQAGKPFIIRATAAKLEVVYNGDAVADPIANGALRGLLNSTMDQDAIDAAALAENSDIYMLKNNELRKANGQTGNSMVEYRAYVVYEDLNVVDADPVPAPGRRVLKMPMQKDQAQGFESIEASEKPMKLMIDGKMYILRGEKMYDATGRLVK